MFARIALVLVAAILILDGLHNETEAYNGSAASKTTMTVRNSKSKESLNIGTSKNKNYQIADYKYQPTQVTQVVIQGKLAKNFDRDRMRASRPPTKDEFAIKERILQLYDQVGDLFIQEEGEHRHSELEMRIDNNPSNTEALYANHFVDRQRAKTAYELLGRVLEALNPKYIATDRVRRASFELNEQVPPLPDYYTKPIEQQPLDLNIASGPVNNQLDNLIQRFNQQVTWDNLFPIQLAAEPDWVLGPQQRAFKRLILCLDQQDWCPGIEEGPEVDPSNKPHHNEGQRITNQNQGPQPEDLMKSTGLNHLLALSRKKLNENQMVFPERLIPKLSGVKPTSKTSSKKEAAREAKAAAANARYSNSNPQSVPGDELQLDESLIQTVEAPPIGSQLWPTRIPATNHLEQPGWHQNERPTYQHSNSYYSNPNNHQANLNHDQPTYNQRGQQQQQQQQQVQSQTQNQQPNQRQGPSPLDNFEGRYQGRYRPAQMPSTFAVLQQEYQHQQMLNKEGFDGRKWTG